MVGRAAKAVGLVALCYVAMGIQIATERYKEVRRKLESVGL